MSSIKLPDIEEFLSLSCEEQASLAEGIARTLRGSWIFIGLGAGKDKLPTFVDYQSGIAFKLVFSGTFQMGCSEAEEAAASRIEKSPNISFDELRPVHTKCVGPFLMSITPVLNGEYLCQCGALRSGGKGWSNYPVAVTRDEACAFCEKLGCRLPREVEWEYACRATSRTLFPWGDILLSKQLLEPWLNINFSSGLQTECNMFGFKGLFSGEWCLDEYRPTYNEISEANTGKYVIRGGGSLFWPWQSSGEWVWCMSSMRMPSSDLSPEGLCGFRLVREVNIGK